MSKCNFLLSTCLLLAQFCIAQPEKTKLGNQVLGAIATANNSGMGMGVSLEYFFPSLLKWSFVGKLYSTSVVIKKSLGGGYQNPTASDLRAFMFFADPTIRFYPGKTQGFCRYALGVGVLIGLGEGRSNGFSNGTNDLQYRGIFALIISNGVHFQIGRHIRSSIELGIGPGSDNGLNSAFGPGFNVIGTATFGLGYRF